MLSGDKRRKRKILKESSCPIRSPLTTRKKKSWASWAHTKAGREHSCFEFSCACRGISHSCSGPFSWYPCANSDKYFYPTFTGVKTEMVISANKIQTSAWRISYTKIYHEDIHAWLYAVRLFSTKQPIIQQKPHAVKLQLTSTDQQYYVSSEQVAWTH